MKKTILFLSPFIIFIVLSPICSFAQNYSQRDIVVKVVDKNGTPIYDIDVLVEDGLQSQEQFTNIQGLAKFRINDAAKLKIFAADIEKKNNVIMTFGKKPAKKHKYGIACLIPKQSKGMYEITLPYKYNNKYDAAKQLDMLMDILVLEWDLYSLKELLKVMGGGKNALGQYGGGLGVPGVFSVSPIPERDHNGKLGFRISGILVDKYFGPLICVTSLDYNCSYYIDSNNSY